MCDVLHWILETALIGAKKSQFTHQEESLWTEDSGL